MGREAICKCDWAGVSAEVKALLETREIILRGSMRKRLRFEDLKDIRADAGRLCFTVKSDPVQLFLGAAAAEKWAAAIKSPPSLAKKLGITNEIVVRSVGSIDDKALASALAEAGDLSTDRPDMIVACVDTLKSLHAALKATNAQLTQGVPIWLVYAKGPGHLLSESSIRSLLRDRGMIDTKVASVSARLTATRFSARKS
jgi:hypothetical protein